MNFNRNKKSIVLLTILIIFTYNSTPIFKIQSENCPITNGQTYSLKELISSPYFITPFQDIFSNPDIVDQKSKVCRNDSHCMFVYQMNVYEIQMRPFDNAVQECRKFPPTRFISFNGSIPGKTFVVPQGVQSYIRVNNKITNKFFESGVLCTNENKTGRPIAMHNHGMASLASFDGWAESIFCQGETKDYVYPNNDPKTLWYHDHSLELTADNNYYGMAGMYIVSAKKKHGGCGQPYNLQNIEEKIMIISDVVIDSECQLLYDKLKYHSDDLMGDINLVNGIPFPLMPLDPKWYRFRILDASASRSYRLMIKDEQLNVVSNQICKVFATDGGFKFEAVNFPINGLVITPSQRYEIACDFSSYKGKTLYIWNQKILDLPYFCYTHLIAKIVVSSNQVTNIIFDSLKTPNQKNYLMNLIFNADDLTQANRLCSQGIFHRQMNFLRTNGQWRINDQNWHTYKIAAQNVGINTWQIWKFVTGSQGQHSVHMHLVDFYILRRDTDNVSNIVQPYEAMSPKDTFFLGPNQSVFVLVRFGAHKGDYMFHCHNLVHQDNLMIRAYSIVQQKNSLQAAQKSRFIINPFFNILYSNFKYTDQIILALESNLTSSNQPLQEISKDVLIANIYQIFYPRLQEQKLIDFLGILNPWKSKSCFSDIQQLEVHA